MWGIDHKINVLLRAQTHVINHLTHIERMLKPMATQAQLDQLKSDVAALIAAGVAEITAAVAAAQNASPDPAIDTLDATVTAATKNLTDAAAALALPPAAPAP